MYIRLYIYYRTADLCLISVTKVNLNVQNMVNITIFGHCVNCEALEYSKVRSMDEKATGNKPAVQPGIPMCTILSS
jgi:hypothetical protein